MSGSKVVINIEYLAYRGCVTAS